MEARQSLGAAVQLTRCREIQVTIENHDNIPGRIALGVLLTDSTSIGKPTLYLDQQPVISTEPGHFSVKSSPVQEVLRFPVPRSFKQLIDLMRLPSFSFPIQNARAAGAKIAIQEFELTPTLTRHTRRQGQKRSRLWHLRRAGAQHLCGPRRTRQTTGGQGL